MQARRRAEREPATPRRGGRPDVSTDAEGTRGVRAAEVRGVPQEPAGTDGAQTREV